MGREARVKRLRRADANNGDGFSYVTDAAGLVNLDALLGFEKRTGIQVVWPRPQPAAEEGVVVSESGLIIPDFGRS